MESPQIVELLLAMRQEMNANTKAMQEQADANTKAMQELQDIKSGQAEMIAAIEGEMDAAIHSVQSKVQETIEHKMENVMTEGLHTELYETQKDSQVTKASLNTQRNDFMETIRDTKEYLELKLISFKDNTQNLISSKQDNMEAKLESTRLKFQSQLEEVMARAELGKRQGVCTSTAQPPTFDGTTSGPRSGASSKL
jgi:hypothetical protein